VWIETTKTLWLDHQSKESKMVSQAILLVTCWLSTLQTREQKPPQSTHGWNTVAGTAGLSSRWT
jgi:hypothetical protein